MRRLLISIALMTAIAATHAQANSILDAKGLTSSEKNYLSTVVRLLTEDAPKIRLATNQSYRTWRVEFDQLKVPKKFSAFHKKLQEAIDQHVFTESPQANTPTAPATNLFVVANDAFVTAWPNSDPDVKENVEEALFSYGGVQILR